MTMIQTFPAGAGVGVPSGGTTGQALVKNSNTDKDVTWSTITPGHIIEDSAAAAIQRDTVQIKGLNVSDDSTNQKTVIEGVGLNSDSLDDIASGSVNNIFIQPSYDYSTTEKIVGRWVDGKPIYQRTYFSTVNKSNIKINHGISSLDRIIKIETNFRTTNTSTIWQVASGSFMTGTPTGFSDAWNVYFTSTQMCIDASSNGPSVGDMYITVCYTKTTD